MKLELKKTKLKNLSKDKNVLPLEATPQIGGGDGVYSVDCNTLVYSCPTDQCSPSVGGGCATSTMC